MSYFGLAALELTLLGVLSGVVGSMIVLRRRAFFAVALSHATFPGGVVFALIGAQVLLGQALFAAVLVLVMVGLARVPGQGGQVASGVVLSFGFALGTLLASLNPGLGVPVEALLVGSPLSVTPGDVAATGAVLILALLVGGLTARSILFETFDPRGFEGAGFRAWPVELAVATTIAAATVVAMPAVGAILGPAMLIAPAAAARLLVRDVRWLPVLAAALGVLGGLVGLWASRVLDLAAGGAVGLTMTAIFVLAYAGRRIAARSRRRGAARTARPATTPTPPLTPPPTSTENAIV